MAAPVIMWGDAARVASTFDTGWTTPGGTGLPSSLAPSAGGFLGGIGDLFTGLLKPSQQAAQTARDIFSAVGAYRAMDKAGEQPLVMLPTYPSAAPQAMPAVSLTSTPAVSQPAGLSTSALVVIGLAAVFLMGRR